MIKIKKEFRNHWKPIIFSLSIFIFIVLVKLLLSNQVSYFDDFVYSIVSKLRCNLCTSLFKFISFLCSTWFVIIVTCIYMLFAKSKKRGFYIALNILLCCLLNQGFKFLFARARPTNINLIVEKGYSFPSGHSMISLSFYGFFIYLIYHKRMKKKKKLLYISLLSLLTLLIGISRIYLGVHYASDVLAGFALSMAYLIIFIQFVYKKGKNL